MNLWIAFEASTPPSGHIQLCTGREEGLDDGPRAIRFVGWLDLLRALADVIADGGDQEANQALGPFGSSMMSSARPGEA